MGCGPGEGIEEELQGAERRAVEDVVFEMPREQAPVAFGAIDGGGFAAREPAERVYAVAGDEAGVGVRSTVGTAEAAGGGVEEGAFVGAERTAAADAGIERGSEAEERDDGPGPGEQDGLEVLGRRGLDCGDRVDEAVEEAGMRLLAGGPEQDFGDEGGAAEPEQVGTEPARPVDEVECGERLQLATGLEVEGGGPAGEGFEHGAESAARPACAFGEHRLHAEIGREQAQDATGLAVLEGTEHNGVGHQRGRFRLLSSPLLPSTADAGGR